MACQADSAPQSAVTPSATPQSSLKTTGAPSDRAWVAPQFEEIRMDAEIGSYQDDFDFDDWH